MFIGGQIKEEHRGKMVAVIRRLDKNEENIRYEVLTCPVVSDDFVDLTGVLSAHHHSIKRVYSGISREAADKIVRGVDLMQSSDELGEIHFRAFDEGYVEPYFWNQNLEKPQRIVLESTLRGYRVAGEF